MKLYKKTGNTIQVLSFPSEEIEKGSYLSIDDQRSGKSLVVQVIDIQFASVPGVMEEFLRELSAEDCMNGQELDPLDVSSHILYIQDARLLICKIHGTLERGKLRISGSWLPSRTHSIVRKLPVEDLIRIIGVGRKLPIELGETMEGSKISINATDLDGKLNIITGKKGTGKSHFSKLLVLGLVKYGATVVVLDLNGEYVNLGFSKDGGKNSYHRKIHILKPGENFKVAFYSVDLSILLRILVHALDLPGTSAREFRRIWRFLKDKGQLNLHELGEAIKNWNCNVHVRDALYSRYYALLRSGIFTDNLSEAIFLDRILEGMKNGGAVIIDLSDTTPSDRRIIVEYVLGKIQEALSTWKIKAVFLFAEEAHLYLRETYWDDVITRMRHFGLFTTFITNQPNTIKENIYRQADNIFLFNFVNDHDLEAISRAAKADAETVISIVRDLPPHHCLILGTVVRDLPIVVKVKPLDVQTMGNTRLFF
ncbi:TPA: ATP-binding protein [Candidatus Bathyarchaeota archaeon]|nr:ATP-binding protein [Candidatus Bathyarchaeota archaeon]